MVGGTPEEADAFLPAAEVGHRLVDKQVLRKSYIRLLSPHGGYIAKSISRVKKIKSKVSDNLRLIIVLYSIVLTNLINKVTCLKYTRIQHLLSVKSRLKTSKITSFKRQT